MLAHLTHGAQGVRDGRAYVLQQYTWPVTLDRVETLLDEWFPIGGGQ